MDNEILRSGPAADEYVKVPLYEKLAYLIPETMMSMYYFLILSLCIFFYTDVVGLPATLVGTMVVISRICDAVTDMVAGMVVDKTKSKYGKAGGTVLRFIVPMCIFLILMYMVPEGLSQGAKVAYFFVTYNLTVSLGFTFVNTAWMTIPSLMSRDQGQRGQLFAWMMVASPIGSAIGVGTALPMIRHFGNDQRAWIITMAIFSVIGIVLMCWGAVTCKERVYDDIHERGEKIPLKDMVRAAMTDQFFVMVILSCLQAMFLIGFSTMMTYFSTYFIKSTMFTSVINNAQQLSMALVSILMIYLVNVRHIKKDKLLKIGTLTAIPAQLIMLIDITSKPILLTSIILRSFGFGILSTGLFMMLSDTIEYNHWRTGMRTDSISTSAQGVGNKIGILIASGVFPILMGVSGYDGTLEVQPESAMNMIKYLFVFVPIFIAVAGFILAQFYKVDKLWDQIQRELPNCIFHPDAKYLSENDRRLRDERLAAASGMAGQTAE